jgi:hypothetical protein
MKPSHRLQSAARLVGALSLATLVAGCTSAAALNPISSPPQSGAPFQPSGFYLRAWRSQALAPQYTFGTLPTATISGGQFFDGMVAIPMIYPGPIYVGLSTRTISAAGIDEIAAEANADGLLGTQASFGQTAPGGVSCNVLMVIAGVTHALTGACPVDVTASAAPGTAEAYNAFWNKLQGIGTWLAADLGSSVPYPPTSLAVLVIPAVAASGAPMAPGQVTWPLTTPFASFGTPAGSADYRCAVVTGEDLAALLPAVQGANQLTNFVDSQGVSRSLQVRVLTPGDAGPC